MFMVALNLPDIVGNIQSRQSECHHEERKSNLK
ncbi:MAG: hypothetical protein ACJAZP_003750 [Psychromonas sp.]|jgi:hypothetical protein